MLPSKLQPAVRVELEWPHNALAGTVVPGPGENTAVICKFPGHSGLPLLYRCLWSASAISRLSPTSTTASPRWLTSSS